MADLPLFVELHVLRSHAPSNLNRDDLGTPKTAIFGGVRRLRISSQCLKRTWRTSPFFRGELAESELGIRTQRVPHEVFGKLGDDYDANARQALAALFAALGKKAAKSGAAAEGDEDDNDEATAGADEVAVQAGQPETVKTDHLLFLSRQEIDEIAAFARDKAADLAQAIKVVKKKPTVDSEKLKKLREDLKKHLKARCSRNAVDVALFGRFLTSDEFGECDAALQVAHALGTQKAELEYDYFTAVDDLSNETGAGHLGETEFGASVFYEYAVCDFPSLCASLGGDRALAVRALKAVVKAMARAVPTGKKNGTAPHNPADYVEVIVRRDQPVSLANAFLRPVRPAANTDTMDVSITALRDQADRYMAAYGNDKDQIATFILSLRDACEGTVKSIDDLGAALEKALAAEAG